MIETILEKSIFIFCTYSKRFHTTNEQNCTLIDGRNNNVETVLNIVLIRFTLCKLFGIGCEGLYSTIRKWMLTEMAIQYTVRCAKTTEPAKPDCGTTRESACLNF
jgi:hypothetical protein